MPMRYEWDEAKRHSNIQRHGIDFMGIERVFAGRTVTILDDRFDYGETRFITLGLLSGRVVVIAHTETREASESFRFERRQRMKKPAGKSRTDGKRVDALQDQKIDFRDTPELTPEMFARAIVRRGLKPVARKRQLTIRIDGDVLEWYRRQGPGYQTRINALLRAYMQEHPRKNA
jgi:uncharacterized protein (DUF4415 family)/uncharacterized DUF497 family protein